MNACVDAPDGHAVTFVYQLQNFKVFQSESACETVQDSMGTPKKDVFVEIKDNIKILQALSSMHAGGHHSKLI